MPKLCYCTRAACGHRWKPKGKKKPQSCPKCKQYGCVEYVKTKVPCGAPVA